MTARKSRDRDDYFRQDEFSATISCPPRHPPPQRFSVLLKNFEPWFGFRRFTRSNFDSVCAGEDEGIRHCCIQPPCHQPTKTKLKWTQSSGMGDRAGLGHEFHGHELSASIWWLGVRSGLFFGKNIFETKISCKCWVTRLWLMIVCWNVSPPLPLISAATQLWYQGSLNRD